MGARYFIGVFLVILFATGFLVATINTFADENKYEYPISVTYVGTGSAAFEYIGVYPLEVSMEDDIFGTLTQTYPGEEFYASVPPKITLDMETGLSPEFPVAYYISANSEGYGDFYSYIKSYRVLIGLKISEINSFPENAIAGMSHLTVLEPNQEVSVGVGGGTGFSVSVSKTLEVPDYSIYVAYPGTEGFYLWHWNGFVMIGSWFSSHPLGHKGTIEWTFDYYLLGPPEYIDVAGVVALRLDENILRNYVNNKLQVYILEEVEWIGYFSTPLGPVFINPYLGKGFILGDDTHYTCGPYIYEWTSDQLTYTSYDYYDGNDGFIRIVVS